VVVAGSAFSAAAVANELALADRPANASRFGPTDPALEPPACTDPVEIGSTARLQLRMDGSIDGTYTGQVALNGIRSKGDVSWNGFGATRYALGQQGMVRIGARVWMLSPASRWTEVEPGLGTGWDTDRQIASVALTPAAANAPEDRGLSFIDGARARTAGSRSTARSSGGSCPGSRCWSAAPTSRAGGATWTTGCSPTASWARWTGP